MPVATFTKPRRSPKLFSDFNTLQFASVMGMVLFVLLLAFMMEIKPYGGGVSVDLPKVFRPVSMPGANREDAIRVAVTRDGVVFFGSERVIDLADLQGKIRANFRDRAVERKVYIMADARARWGTVKLVLHEVHDAGIVRVAFLAEQRRLH